jgi:uridine kinase
MLHVSAKRVNPPARMPVVEAAHEEQLAGLLDRIVRVVRARRPPGEMATRIVAIDGPGGSGKSSFARHLAGALGGVPIVQTDDFASWDNPIDWWPDLLERVLVPLSRGETARFERSRWGPETGGELVVVEPAAVVILEGVTATREAFMPYVTYSIWVDAPAEVRLQRGVDRDGSAALGLWQAWMAGEEAYRSRERPDERADLVLRGDRDLWT